MAGIVFGVAVTVVVVLLDAFVGFHIRRSFFFWLSFFFSVVNHLVLGAALVLVTLPPVVDFQSETLVELGPEMALVLFGAEMVLAKVGAEFVVLVELGSERVLEVLFGAEMVPVKVGTELVARLVSRQLLPDLAGFAVVIEAVMPAALSSVALPPAALPIAGRLVGILGHLL